MVRIGCASDSDGSIRARNWHGDYDDPTSALSARLAIVQDELRQALTQRPPGAIRLVSVCAGEGRDLDGVLRDHPRTGDVHAALVEVDPVHIAAARLRMADLPQVTVVEADASLTDSYAGYVPADVLLVCGLFGNISDEDIRRTVSLLPQLCAVSA
jgi:hypothetical protein